MAFIPSRRKKHATGPVRVSLNLTSMMDMFTIIIVFLIKTYSTEGQLIHPSKNLTLPSSTVETAPEVALDVVVSQEWIMVNDRPVIRVASLKEQRDLFIPELNATLLKYATEAKRIEEKYGIKFTGKVTIQGDKKLPFGTLLKVMATCGRSEYPNMRLVVYQKSG
ncbi:biopolymer transporter ExbD [candidate division KSB1 bacterium]|nr:biopolymer transporter ExbD [candidate division KSB1 bacterium]